MKAWVLVILLLVMAPLAAWAEEGSYTDPEERGFPADYQEVETDPEVSTGIQKYAQDAQEGAQENFGIQPVHDNELFYTLSFDRLEYQTKEDKPALVWDMQAWIGKDYNKLYVESEGVRLLEKGKFEEAMLEVLYARTIATYWEFRLGVRYDFNPDPSRYFGVVGVQGLAPQWFEVDANAYVSEDGDISATLEIEYDILLSQRLILQPRFEAMAAVQEVEKYGVYPGINVIELGARLRYEIVREFAPYIGISWERKVGEKANITEKEGKPLGRVSLVLGVTFWM